jgi:hypothetical protein
VDLEKVEYVAPEEILGLIVAKQEKVLATLREMQQLLARGTDNGTEER